MNGLLIALVALLFLSSQSPHQKVNTLEEQLSSLASYEERFEELQSISIDSIWYSVPAIEDTITKIDVIHAYIDRLHGEIDAARGEDALDMSY